MNVGGPTLELRLAHNGDSSAGRQLPEQDGMIVATGGDEAPVWTHGDVPDPSPVAALRGHQAQDFHILRLWIE